PSNKCHLAQGRETTKASGSVWGKNIFPTTSLHVNWRLSRRVQLLLAPSVSAACPQGHSVS
ncbi:MAG: hypothetical protein AAGM40_04225, partial [Cyanobacteria bacterium J06573_2]